MSRSTDGNLDRIGLAQVAEALKTRAVRAEEHADWREVAACYAELAEVATEIGDRELRVAALLGVSEACKSAGDVDAELEALTALIVSAKEFGPFEIAAAALDRRGALLQDRQSFDEALIAFHESTALARASGASDATQVVLGLLRQVQLLTRIYKRFPEALPLAQEARRLVAAHNLTSFEPSLHEATELVLQGLDLETQ